MSIIESYFSPPPPQFNLAQPRSVSFEQPEDIENEGSKWKRQKQQRAENIEKVMVAIRAGARTNSLISDATKLPLCFVSQLTAHLSGRGFIKKYKEAGNRPIIYEIINSA